MQYEVIPFWLSVLKEILLWKNSANLLLFAPLLEKITLLGRWMPSNSNGLTTAPQPYRLSPVPCFPISQIMILQTLLPPESHWLPSFFPQSSDFTEDTSHPREAPSSVHPKPTNLQTYLLLRSCCPSPSLSHQRLASTWLWTSSPLARIDCFDGPSLSSFIQHSSLPSDGRISVPCVLSPSSYCSTPGISFLADLLDNINT